MDTIVRRRSFATSSRPSEINWYKSVRPTPSAAQASRAEQPSLSRKGRIWLKLGDGLFAPLLAVARLDRPSSSPNGAKVLAIAIPPFKGYRLWQAVPLSEG